MKTLMKFLLFVVLLAGCQSATPTSIPGESTPVGTATATAELAPPPEAIIAPTLPPEPTATSDARLPPEQWQDWPVVPVVTGRAIEIYRVGQAMGNDTHAFSKVGDCQSVRAAFMGFFDIPERYNLGPDYQYLQEAIDNFTGYFNTDGQAVKGGYTAATVLSPFRANPDFCLAGENPLECEFRITKPIIAFVSFEYWWEGRTADNYENYMRQIIELTMAHGVVPILSTKADNIEGDHSINLTTARLAHEYDLPLWNFWRSVQTLPYYGLDVEGRNDGFHLSTDGWNYRSFTGLQTLDSIWRGVRDATALVLATPEPTPSPEVSTGFLPTPSSGPWFSAGSDQIIFGMAGREAGAYQPLGVYLYDFSANTRVQILGYGWDFQAASPDGMTILVNQGSSLYKTDGMTLTLVSSDYYFLGNTGAMYLADGGILFIKKTGTGTALVKQNAAGGEMVVLTQAADAPIDLYPSTDGVNIAWESGSCSSYLVCDRQGAWLTDLSTGGIRFLSGISNPLIDPAGIAMAFEYSTGIGTSNLGFATADGIPTRNYPLYGDILEDYAWQPEGDWLAVHLAIRVEHSGKITDGTNYLIDPETFATQQLPSILLLNPSLLWSRDGDRLAWLGTGWLTDKYVIQLFEVDIDTNKTTNLTGAVDLGDPAYIYVTNSAWLPEP